MKVFNEQHDMFRATVRSFVEKEVMPHVEAWEAAGRMPKTVFRRMGELGFLGLEYDEKFGGAGLDTMYITTAAGPGDGAGGLFAFRPGVAGLPTNPYRG